MCNLCPLVVILVNEFSRYVKLGGIHASMWGEVSAMSWLPAMKSLWANAPLAFESPGCPLSSDNLFQSIPFSMATNLYPRVPCLVPRVTVATLHTRAQHAKTSPPVANVTKCLSTTVTTSISNSSRLFPSQTPHPPQPTATVDTW